MDLIIGGLYQGKTKYINEHYNLTLTESNYFSKFVNQDVVVLLNCHMFEGDISEYIKDLPEDKQLIVSTALVGNAIVPIHRSEREYRDNVGITNKFLAANSNKVIRVWNGLSETIKC